MVVMVGMGLGGSCHDFGKRRRGRHHWSASKICVNADETHVVAACKIGTACAGPAVGGERIANEVKNGSDSNFLSVHVDGLVEFYQATVMRRRNSWLSWLVPVTSQDPSPSSEESQ